MPDNEWREEKADRPAENIGRPVREDTPRWPGGRRPRRFSGIFFRDIRHDFRFFPSVAVHPGDRRTTRIATVIYSAAFSVFSAKGCSAGERSKIGRLQA